MPKFLSADLERFARELTFTPPERRRLHLENAEQLYWQIDEDRTYPIDFVVFRVTGYRPEDVDDTLLPGAALKRDLLTLVEQTSATLDDRTTQYDPPAIGIDALAERLRVTAKTLSRYRRDGLFSRKLVFPDGRRRVAFCPDSIERFLDARPGKLDKASRFTRIDDDTRHAILMRARRVRQRVDVSPHRIARHLAKKFSRSVESIRRLLIKHDERDPRVAIFPEHTPPLTEKQQRVVHRAYHRGVPVQTMARRYNRGRNAMYRALFLRRAEALRAMTIRYTPSPTFELPDAETVILGSPLPPLSPTDARDALRAVDSGEMTVEQLAEAVPRLSQVPAMDAETEQRLFVRYNFLKFRAAQARDRLDRHQPQARRIDRIETYLRRAVAIKQTLSDANLHHVIAVALQHTTGSRKLGIERLPDLIRAGRFVLGQSIDQFDAGQYARFATYLTYALMRAFAQYDRDDTIDMTLEAFEARQARASRLQEATRAAGSTERPIAQALAPADDPSLTISDIDAFVERRLPTLMEELEERERRVIARRYGLAAEGDDDTSPPVPQTLEAVADEMGIGEERVRRIERRAIRKLRRAMRRDG